MYVAYFQDLSIEVPINCENYMKPVEACENYISKCPDISEISSPSLIRIKMKNEWSPDVFWLHLVI